MANERKIRIPFPLPNSPLREANEVQIKESTERWTEVALEDGTVIRLKVALISAARIDNEWDAEGNPAYSLKMSPQVIIVSTPENFKKPAVGTPIQ
jgi:hypothetical protein